MSYNLNSQQTFRLMQGRLGIYDKYQDPNKVIDNNLIGVENQQIRLDAQGGSIQQKRMIADKRRSLDRALHFSYQGANVKKVSPAADVVRALINPNKLKPDYDDKIISIGFEHNFAVGDVFEWIDTNSKWIIYLQDLTELAYFRGDIRRCSHEISWEDENGKHTTYAAIRGPVETRLDTAKSHGLVMDNPNYSLSIIIPKNEDTLKYFQRYGKFYLGADTDPYRICWRIEATDWISMPGAIEITATEYYQNKDEDDIGQGIVGALIVEPVNPNDEAVEETILGESFIKPKKLYTFEYRGNLEGEWSVSDGNIKLIQRGKFVDLRWLDTYSGEFELIYAGKYKKIIIVESLF